MQKRIWTSWFCNFDIGASIVCFVEGRYIQMSGSMDVSNAMETISGVQGKDIPGVLCRDIDKVGDCGAFLR